MCMLSILPSTENNHKWYVTSKHFLSIDVSHSLAFEVKTNVEINKQSENQYLFGKGKLSLNLKILFTLKSAMNDNENKLDYFDTIT